MWNKTKKAVLSILILILITGCTMFNKKYVGKNISNDDIQEFYYTYSTSTFPPEYQRYHFYKENGNLYFYHDYRSGETFPLTEKDTKQSGKILLDQDTAKQFYALLENGVVEKRKERLESGSAGPWLYLYWENDKGKYQEFSFESYTKLKEFEEFCKALKAE